MTPRMRTQISLFTPTSLEKETRRESEVADGTRPRTVTVVHLYVVKGSPLL